MIISSITSRDMLTKTTPIFFFLLLPIFFHVTASKEKTDYEKIIAMEDPLKPIWDKIDRIPEELERTLKSKFDQFFSQTVAEVEKLNTRMESLEGRLNQTLAALKHEIEDKIERKLTFSEARVREDVSSLASVTTNNSNLISNVEKSVTNISASMSSFSDLIGDVTSCAAYVNRTQEDAEQNTNATSPDGELINESLQELRNVMSQLRDVPVFLPQDCSDHHYQNTVSTSGVYTTYPTMDARTPVPVYCEMEPDSEEDQGGWTVILRRRNTSWGIVDFNRTWEEYRTGFGEPGEGEWWYGLSYVHALTYRQPYQLKIHMHDVEHGYYEADYHTFRVESESRGFALILRGFYGNVSTDSLHHEHQGRPFSTVDRDRDGWPEGSCAQEYMGGWWYSSCVYSTLTAPLATPTTHRGEKVLRWVRLEAGQALILDDVTMKIRPNSYRYRFKPQRNDGE